MRKSLLYTFLAIVLGFAQVGLPVMVAQSIAPTHIARGDIDLPTRGGR